MAPALVVCLFACASTVPRPLPERATPPAVRLALSSLRIAPQCRYSFVLYDTGEVIVQRKMWTREAEFFTVTLTPAEVEQLLATVRANELLGLDALYSLTETASDLGAEAIDVADPRTHGVRTITVHGMLPASGTSLPIPEDPPPPAFLRAYQVLGSYSHPRERPWIPRFLEIAVYARSGKGGCPWPADWADLDSPGSERLRAKGDRIGWIRETGTRLSEVQQFMEKCRFDVNLRGEPVHLQLHLNLPHQVEGP